MNKATQNVIDATVESVAAYGSEFVSDVQALKDDTRAFMDAQKQLVSDLLDNVETGVGQPVMSFKYLGDALIAHEAKSVGDFFAKQRKEVTAIIFAVLRGAAAIALTL